MRHVVWGLLLLYPTNYLLHWSCCVFDYICLFYVFVHCTLYRTVQRVFKICVFKLKGIRVFSIQSFRVPKVPGCEVAELHTRRVAQLHTVSTNFELVPKLRKDSRYMR